MEEFKLIDIKDNIIYFTHIIKNQSYESSVAQQLFKSLTTFGIADSPDRIVAIFEINISKKRIDLLILQLDTNAYRIDAANKNTLNEYDSMLKRLLVKNSCNSLITYNLINTTDSGGLFSIDRNGSNLTGEKSFIRKYRLSLDNIIVGNIATEKKKEDKEVGFRLEKVKPK